jgi:anti-anti-sigma factor
LVPASRADLLFLFYSQIVDTIVPADILGVEVAKQGPGTRIVTVTGELDALTAPTLGAVLTETVTAAQVVVIDLDGVRYLASAGLQVLIEAHQLATDQRSDLWLVCNSPGANRVLDGSGLREHFIFADSVALALSQ